MPTTTVVIVLTVETPEDQDAHDAADAVLDTGTIQDAMFEWGEDHDKVIEVTGAYSYSEEGARELLCPVDSRDFAEPGNEVDPS